MREGYEGLQREMRGGPGQVPASGTSWQKALLNHKLLEGSCGINFPGVFFNINIERQKSFFFGLFSSLFEYSRLESDDFLSLFFRKARIRIVF